MTWNLPDSLIQLKDDNIIDVMIYDSESRMCDTCDYGRTYLSEVDFVTPNRIISVHFTNTDEEMSHGRLITLLVNNLEQFSQMTHEEFKEFLQNENREKGELYQYLYPN